MGRWLKTTLVGSLGLIFVGLIGVPSVLNSHKISSNQFFQSITWYAGFKEAAARWPFIVAVVPAVLNDASNEGTAKAFFECAEIDCPLEKMTEISRKYTGHLQPFTGHFQPSRMFDSQGGTSKKYIADLREMEKELVIAYYQHLIPSYLDLGTSRKSIGNRGDVSLLSFMDDRGVRIEDILFDTRASSTLFWLIWSTVFGTLGSITCIVFWLRGRRV